MMVNVIDMGQQMLLLQRIAAPHYWKDGPVSPMLYEIQKEA